MQEYTVMNLVADFNVYMRGLDYYRRNRVGSFKYEGINQFSVPVRGSRKYQVTLSFDATDRLRRASCTCPYDRGYCKPLWI